MLPSYIFAEGHRKRPHLWMKGVTKFTLNLKKYTECRTGSIRDKQVSMPLFFITLTSKKGNHIWISHLRALSFLHSPQPPYDTKRPLRRTETFYRQSNWYPPFVITYVLFFFFYVHALFFFFRHLLSETSLCTVTPSPTDAPSPFLFLRGGGACTQAIWNGNPSSIKLSVKIDGESQADCSDSKLKPVHF